MTYEYLCPSCGQVFENFFKSFSEAGRFIDKAPCDCTDPEITWADRIASAPLGFGLYGCPEGWSKPSPTKRFNTKTVSGKTGNRDACG